MRGFSSARLQVGDFAADQFKALTLLSQREANIAEGIAAQVGFGPADFHLFFAIRDGLPKGRHLRVLSCQGFLRAVTTQ